MLRDALRPVLRNPLRRPLDTLRRSGLAAQIMAIYDGGQPGLWYDQSSQPSLYQDSAGTAPVTAAEQPNGLILDRSGRANHASQATTTARPLWSARVNLLIKTEDFTQWSTDAPGVPSSNAATAPTGAQTASVVNVTGGNTIRQSIVKVATDLPYAGSVWIQRISGVTDLAVRFVSNGAAITASVITPTLPIGTWVRVAIVGQSGAFSDLRFDIFCTVPGSYAVWGGQVEPGSVATRYQRVNTATDYDTSGFPQYDKFDGIDDGLSTATFAAGALTNNMDYFIAIRRDSTAATMLASLSTAGATWFGAMDTVGGSASNGGGTPTYAVNGVAVPGGIASTRAQLNAAVPVGQWVIVGIHNLDLSGWTAFLMGNYGGFLLNAAVAGVVLCPAQTTAGRATIRTYLGQKVGLSL